MMNKGKPRYQYPGPEGMFALSLICHLAIGFVLLRAPLVPQIPPEPAPVYVDVVTLPVASPQVGTPAPSQAPPSAAAEQAPEQPAAVAPLKPQHTAPAPKKSVSEPMRVPKKGPARPEEKKPAPADEGSAFEERMAKLSQAAEAKRMDDVLANLKKKGGGKVGMPGGKGTEAGSDYSSYVQSRLRDAFRSTIASESKAPRVVLRLTIGSDGRVVRYRLEQSTGDRVFEDAVDRAVHLAEKTFRPPPGGGEFEQGFVFRPQGVGVR